MRFEKETNLYQDAAIANKFSSQETQFNVVNGKISYLISDSDIEEYEDKSKTVTSRLNSSEDSIDKHSRQISSLQTNIVGINGDIDTFKSEVNTFEQTTNSTISSITSTVATKTQVWTVQPTVPYLANDFWIRDNVLYVCTVSRTIGSFNASDWKPATKGRIFTSEPTTPYYSGDAWMQGDTGEILFCNATRLTGNCNIDDWKKASKYTDDSAFTNWTQNTYNSFIEQLPSQINLQVTGSREVNANTKYTSKASIIATINDQTFESGVRINADRITLDGDATINAINGATGNVVVNANKINLSGYTTLSNLQNGTTIIDGACIKTGTIVAARLDLSECAKIESLKNGTTIIDGGCITTGSLDASKITTGVLQSKNKNIKFDLDTGNITMNSGSININDKFIVNTDGSVTLTAATITGYATDTSVDSKLDNYPTTDDLQTKGKTIINGDNITTGKILASYLDLDGVLKVGALDDYPTEDDVNVKLNNYPTKDNLKTSGQTVIHGGNITANTISLEKLTVRPITEDDVSSSGSTIISGDRITTGVIQSSGLYPNVSLNLNDGSLTMKSGSIDLGRGNFVVDNDGNVTMKKGSITIGSNENFKVDKYGTVIMKSATITGYLKPADIGDSGATTISGNRIKTGTIAAERLDLSGVLKVGALNNYPTKNDLKTAGATEIRGENIKTGTISAERLDLSGVLKVGALDGYATKTSLSAYATTDSLSKGTTTISGGCITTGAITGKNGNVVFDLTDGTLTMNRGSINIGNNFIVHTDGSAELKSVTITGSPSISGYATNAKLNDYVTINNLKASGKTEIHGANITTGTISASHLDLSGVLKVGALDNYATKSSLGSYALKSGLSGGTTTISGACITTGVIKDSDSKVVFDVKNGSLTMNSGSIKIGSNFVVDTDGNLTANTAKITSNTSSKYSASLINGDLKFKYNNSDFAKIDSYYTTASDEYSSVYILVSRGRRSEVSLQASSYSALYIDGDGESSLKSTNFDMTSDVLVIGDLTVRGDFNVEKSYGKKNKIIKTKDYGSRELYSYETASPLFGDVGSGVISEDGICYIQIDPIFNQTISVNLYQVFLQKCGEGDCYIYKKDINYFIVKGTPFLKFDWEIKCRQIYFENARLDNNNFTKVKCNNDIKYDAEASEYLNALKNERLDMK